MSPRGKAKRLPDVQQLVAAAQTPPKPAYNSKAVVLNSDEICQRLGISRRTLDRRLRGEWKEGYWFFKQKGRWYIRESHLEELIRLMEFGKL